MTIHQTKREIIMATTKKTGGKKKSEPKKTGFFPKVKSTKKNGMGSY